MTMISVFIYFSTRRYRNGWDVKPDAVHFILCPLDGANPKVHNYRFKRIVLPKMKSFTHLQDVPNTNEFLSFVEHNGRKLWVTKQLMDPTDSNRMKFRSIYMLFLYSHLSKCKVNEFVLLKKHCVFWFEMF